MMQSSDQDPERGGTTVEVINNNNANGELLEQAQLIPASHGGMEDSSTKKRAKSFSKTTTTPAAGGGGANASSAASGSSNNAAGVVVPGSATAAERRALHNAKKKLRNKGDKEVATAIFIKYAALLLLVGQMVGLVLLMRYTRTHRGPNEPLYLASTAVFVMEVMKLIICLVVIAIQSGGALLRELRLHVIQSPMEIIKLSVPSLLYTVQNNLLYLALTNLDAATYQVCYQLKILTTALFSAILLHRKFSRTKWTSLVILTIGVAIVQISGSGDQHNAPDSHQNERHAAEIQQNDGDDDASASGDAVGGSTTTTTTTAAEQQLLLTSSRWVGLIAVLCAACTSGFSGVYFEKILKGSKTSLWIRNVQMGLTSILIAYVTVFVKDSAAVKKQGFLGGYNHLVWTVVTVQAVGGLIVATVVKYADNVLKVFATSFSIVISCIISAFLFDFSPNFLFLVGASLVVTATVMYSTPERKTRRRPVLPVTGAAKSRK